MPSASKTCSTPTLTAPVPTTVAVLRRRVNRPPPDGTAARSDAACAGQARPGWVSASTRLPRVTRSPKEVDDGPLPPVPDTGRPVES